MRLVVPSLLRARAARPLLAALLLALSGTGCPGPAPEPGFDLVFDELPSGLISVWGTASDDVWAVGGDPGDGMGPLVLHYDGAGWERLTTGADRDLWWVTGFGAGQPMFFGGDGGVILRYEGGVFTAMDTPDDTRTVFGIFGASSSDVWAVGGSGGGAGFVWRGDGTTWTEVALPSEAIGRAVFKAWGRSADDVWFVGASGLLMHWDGVALSMVPSGTTRTMLTVHALGERAVAVGGAGSGTMLELDSGGTWRDVTPELAPQMLGVWLTEEGGWAAGLNGVIMRRDASGWTELEVSPSVAGALHAVWVDPDGGVWAVGGRVLSIPLSHGVLFHRGSPVPGGTWTDR